MKSFRKVLDKAVNSAVLPPVTAALILAVIFTALLAAGCGKKDGTTTLNMSEDAANKVYIAPGK
ncbi:MAG TPA: hypothetical protein PKA39_08435, partial [Ignavibacteria bacterium]|nr:hypothetical protein [Ignavibacteria bacterium]